MKNLSKEVIVGLAATIIILLFIWLFSFLKGNNLFYSSDNYYAVYDDIGGMEESSPVEINGYQAGIVRDIEFINDGSGKLLVTIGINSGYKLPLGTVAEITPETVIAGMKIILIIGNSQSFHTSGDTIPGRLDRGIISNLEKELDPVIEKADLLISDIDTLLNGLKVIISDDFRNNLQRSSQNIAGISDEINSILGSSGKSIKDLISGLDEFSQMLGSNSENLDSTIYRLTDITEEISQSELRAGIDNFNEALKETTAILEKLNKGEGSAGLLINDDSLYLNLNMSLEQLNILLKDMKSNPDRYVNFSLFGKKNKN